MPDTGYPLIRHWALGPARGVFKRYRARLQDVPTERAGLAVVLDVDGVLELVPNGVALDQADGIARANSAIFVDVRPKQIEIVATVPCSGRYADFETHVIYACKVTDPVRVVERQADNVRGELTTWTAAVLRRCGDGFPLEEAMAFEECAEEELRTAFAERPPVCSTWMSVDLASVAVPLAQKYRDDANARENNTLSTGRQIHAVYEGNRLEQAKADVDGSVDRRSLLRRRRELEHKSELFDAEAALEDRRLDRERALFDDRVRRYREALAGGVDAVMALIAAEDPESHQQMLRLKIAERNALVGFIFEAEKRGLIDAVDIGPGLIEAAKRIVQTVQHEVPGFAALASAATPAAPDAKSAAPSSEEDTADEAAAWHVDSDGVIDIDPAEILDDVEGPAGDDDPHDWSFLDGKPIADPSSNGAASVR